MDPAATRLRLVKPDDPALMGRWRGAVDAADNVQRENRAAARNREIDPLDPRWVLAVRAYSQLQGSTITPQRRQRLMRTARQLGVRPFEASLVLAIVQDHARQGRQLDAAAGALTLLPPPQAAADRHPHWPRWALAVLLAAAANLLLIHWLLNG